MPQMDMIYQWGGGGRSTFSKVFHSLWLRAGHFLFMSPTAEPYQRRSWSSLWLRFMTPLFPSTSPINWTSSHYPGSSSAVGLSAENNPAGWLSSSRSCSRRGLFSVPYGKCNYSNYCWEVALASGYGATYPWTGRELLLDAIRTNLQCINLFLSLFDLEVCHCC